MLRNPEGLLFDSAEENLDARILELFRRAQGDFVSGEKFSGVLGVSRTAVWKRISQLKALGYSFESAPSRGYRLLDTPDSLVPAEIACGLQTERIGRRIVGLTRTGSTNTVAFLLAEKGTPEGTVVVAEAQDAGKGRMGRRWESPAGVNLYCSVVLRPAIAPLDAAQLTFVSAVAAARAIRREGVVPSIKWPNDLLVNGRKVAGLLNEMNAETDSVNFVVLGIGVNLNMRGDQFPQDLRHPASSLLMEKGEPVRRVDFTRNLLGELDRLYSLYLQGGYREIREEWMVLCEICGKRVGVTCGSRRITGVVTGVAPDGALQLQRDDGGVELVHSGDVTMEG